MTKIHKTQDISPLWKLVADWRSMSIIHAIYEHNSVRYSELQTMLDMSPTTLSKKTKELTQHGIITRKSTPTSKEISYQPTPLCTQLVTIYHSLEEIVASEKHT